MTTTFGFLIAIEGIDGSGKSTLAYNLAQALKQDAVPVLLTKQPGGSNLGKALRTILQEQVVVPEAEFLLFAADRAQHIQEVVLPALKQGYVVISDRMADSSYAYQGAGRGLPLDIISTVNNWVMQGIKPDLTLYIKVTSDIARERIFLRKEKLTTFEHEQKLFFDRVIQGFDALYKDRADVVILDGTLDERELLEKAYLVVQRALKERT
ncbi:MAG: dTMP kinase [Candidatus Dependentiae bacterium]|nr:dTMP kinase [Candidatus Dependentiae bacterium]